MIGERGHPQDLHRPIRGQDSCDIIARPKRLSNGLVLKVDQHFCLLLVDLGGEHDTLTSHWSLQPD